jgi:hypothetical protein
VQRNKLTCWPYANGNDIKEKCDVFAILDILAIHGKVGQQNEWTSKPYTFYMYILARYGNFLPLYIVCYFSFSYAARRNIVRNVIYVLDYTHNTVKRHLRRFRSYMVIYTILVHCRSIWVICVEWTSKPYTFYMYILARYGNFLPLYIVCYFSFIFYL